MANSESGMRLRSTREYQSPDGDEASDSTDGVLLDNNATSGSSVDVSQLLAMMQQQQAALLTMVQEQQRMMQAQNAQLLAQQHSQASSVPSQTSEAGNRASNMPAKLPASSLPEKAAYSMSMQQWRIWRRDMEQYAKIAGWDDRVTVIGLRMQCDDKMKRVIEAEYGDGWENMSVDDAMTALEGIIKKTSNPAREREIFHRLQQVPGESGKAFVHRCEQQALECDLACPHCARDISEWCVRDRVLAGLSSDALKLDLYQNIDKYPSLGSLMTKIEMFESARSGCSPDVDSVAITAGLESSDAVETAAGDDTLLAALKSTYKKSRATQRQGPANFRQRAETSDPRNNGTRNKDRLKGIKCFNCGGIGHKKARCPSVPQTFANNHGDTEGELGQSQVVSPVTTEEFQLYSVHEPRSKLEEVNLFVKHAKCSSPRRCPAVADTGAECCVAGQL